MNLKSNLLINFTSYDFTKYVYGTEKYILENIKQLEKYTDILTIIPFVSKKSRLYSRVYRSFQVFLNEEEIGILLFKDIIKLLTVIKDNKFNKLITIQNIIEFEFDEVKIIFSIFREDTFYIHLHDYSLICSSYNLIDSYNKPCNVENCDKCSYKKNKQILYRFVNEDMPDLNKIVFISPSNYTKNLFAKIYPNYSERIIVIPHDKYEFVSTNKNSKTLNLGYIGAQMDIKGWNDFKSLCEKLDCNIKLYYLGHGSEKVGNVTNIEVGKNGTYSMSNAIKENKIDIAFLGSICPETYSYTLFEAMENGCYILCNELSGNISETVRALNNGYIYRNVNDLIDYINSKNFLSIMQEKSSVYAINKNSNFYFVDKFQQKFHYIEIDFVNKYTLSSKIIRLLQNLKKT